MTQENKELLLKELCARLPYGVIVEDRNGVHKLTAGNTEFTDLLYNGKCNIKPYLIPLSSMTDEQIMLSPDSIHVCDLENLRYDNECVELDRRLPELIDLIDWLNAHHFDYRGLIEKGLALEAHGDMYKID